MKTQIKTALLVAGVALAFQGAYAATSGDLILGFNEQGVSTFDYTADLGNATAIGVGGSSVVDLSLSLNPLNQANGFNSAFAGGPNGVSVGVAGGVGGSHGNVFATTLRSALGNPASQAGETTPDDVPAPSNIGSAAGQVNLVTPLGKLLSADANNGSWSQNVAANATDLSTVGAFATTLQFNPMSVISGSSIVEDLWKNTANGALSDSGWQYQGFFTLNFVDANNASLTFTPSTFVPVPEPTTYGLIAGFGLLALCFRRQLSRRNP